MKPFIVSILATLIWVGGFAQNNFHSVIGIVSDASGVPVQNVAVFIPQTSIWSTTDSNGEYNLKGISKSNIEISFRHLSFETLTKSVELGSQSILRVDVTLKFAELEIDEVVKTASRTSWRLGYAKFSRYVLGDDYGRTCKVSNKEDLNFYYDGDRLIGTANKPLKITNNYLGYQITYYLDYFWWEEKYLLPDDSLPQVSFAFSGSVVYADLINERWGRKSYWKRNRTYQFKGTQRHFMQCIYDLPIRRDSMSIKKVWIKFPDYQKSNEFTPAVAYAKYHEMNKVFYWNSEEKKSSYLNYSPMVVHEIKTREIDTTSTGYSKAFELSQNLLVLFYRRNEGDEEDVRIALCSVDPDSSSEPVQISVDYYGNFSVSGGSIKWEFLDNKTNLFSALPRNYNGREQIN